MVSTLKAWSPNSRLAWLIVLFAVQLLYVPINRTVRGGVILSLPWDSHVPFWPIWAVPYLLSILWWMAAFIWAAWKMDDIRYRAFVAAALVVMLTAWARRYTSSSGMSCCASSAYFTVSATCPRAWAL